MNSPMNSTEQSLPQALPKWPARRAQAAGSPFKHRWLAGLGVWASFSKRESDTSGVWSVER